jgi:hypothetical protein
VDRRYLDVDLHLERIADMAVTVVKLAKLACALPPEPTMLGHLQEMALLCLGFGWYERRAMGLRKVRCAGSGRWECRWKC